MYLGDFKENSTLYFCWSTNDKNGASINRPTNGTIKVYKDDNTTESTTGITDTEAFDNLTGIHNCKIVLTDAFYATGHDYSVVLDGAVIDGETVNAVLATFSIENRFAGSSLFEKAANTIITDLKTGRIDEDKKKRFLEEALKLIKLHSFVMPHKEAYEIKNDIEFIKAIRSRLIKYTVNKKGVIEESLESIIKELVSKSIAAEGVIDIFALQKKEKPDISILDEKFLEEVRKSEYKNLSIEILRKLLSDRIKLRMKKNRIRYKSLLELLDKIIEDYENRILNASKVIERLIELAKEIKKSEKTAEEMGLTEEELAFYDAIASKKLIKQDEKIKEIVKELVKSIRRDLFVDWTNNDIIKARIRDHIRLILLKNQLQPKEVEKITNVVYQQVIYLYKDYNQVSVV